MQAKLLNELLVAEQFSVHAEASGQAALRDAALHRPDLVILDLRLPDMTGYEVCKELRKLYSRWDVPVLMLTAMDAPVDQLRGYAHGADAYIPKPYDLHELKSTIASLLGHTTTPPTDEGRVI